MERKNKEKCFQATCVLEYIVDDEEALGDRVTWLHECNIFLTMYVQMFIHWVRLSPNVRDIARSI